MWIKRVVLLTILTLLYTPKELIGYEIPCKIRSDSCECNSFDRAEHEIGSLLNKCCQLGILKVDIRNVLLRKLSQDSFVKFPCHQIQELKLNGTTQLFGKDFLEKNSFMGLPNLQRLAIINNEDLTEIASGVFQGLSASLTELTLSGNQLKEITGEEFDGFLQMKNRLKFIDLSNNQISSLKPKCFANLKLSANIPSNLLKLNLDKNQIYHIKQDHLLGLENLEELTLRENPIKTIFGGSFRNLKKLHRLSISDSYFPKKRKGGDLTQLTQAMFHGLKNLQELNLVSLGIEEIKDDAFLEISQLKSLNLAHNQIRNIPSIVFERLGIMFGSSLKYLDLSYNEIVCIEDNPFKFLRDLEVLNLSHNKLMIVNDKMFLGLDKLRRLILTGNSFVRIAPYSFRHMKMLNELHLNSLLDRELNIVREAFLESALGVLSNSTRIVGLENMGIQSGGNSGYLPSMKSLESFECRLEEFLVEEMDQMKAERVSKETEENEIDFIGYLKENQKIILLILVTICAVTLVILSILMIYRQCFRSRRKISKERHSRLFSDGSSGSHVKSSILQTDSCNFINNFKSGGYNSAGSFSPISGLGNDQICSPPNSESGNSKLRSLFPQTIIGQAKYRESDILNNLQIAPPPYPQHSRSPFLSHDNSGLMNTLPFMNSNCENLSEASGTLISNQKVSSLIGSSTGARGMSNAGSTERTNITPCTNSSLEGHTRDLNSLLLHHPASPNSLNNDYLCNFDGINNFGLV